MKHDTLGNRMKGYESTPKARLVPRIPVMMRLDGRAFHTFTRTLQKPYDPRLHRAMWAGATALWNDCATVQKRGVCIFREVYTVEGSEGPVSRHRWTVDREIPVFSQDRAYIERFL
jgi:hypothetical protein